uniref:GATA transcription factor 21-like n=1 Tax=Erigeron canadensis TaxID=72917 RepID=UPI001CB95723|nr:GATA transcription factor 21-like [Erigeron canadensis]
MMTPIFFNSSSSTDHTYSPYHHPMGSDDHLAGNNSHQFMNPNYSQALSSSSMNSLAATHLFLNSAVVEDDDQSSGTFDHREIEPPPHHHQQLQAGDDNFGSQANYNDKDNSIDDHQSNIDMTMNSDQHQMIKWPMMSSKMRVMLKMKRSDPLNYIKFYTSSATNYKLETPKQPHVVVDRQKKKDYSPATSCSYPIVMEETDNNSSTINTTTATATSSNNNNNNSSSNNIPMIRVCSDCNTSKTPLWRSGPQGPKSLCNACGIRQRKARRALAIAAENNGNNNILAASASGDQSMVMAPLNKATKSHPSKHFIIKKPSSYTTTNNNNNGQVITKFKKKQYVSKTTMVTTTRITPPSSPSPLPSSSLAPNPKKNGVEDFLVSLSNKYLTTTFNNNNCQVFPQDEKEAAILLMAISCGYAS